MILRGVIIIGDYINLGATGPFERFECQQALQPPLQQPLWGLRNWVIREFPGSVGPSLDFPDPFVSSKIICAPGGVQLPKRSTTAVTAS